MKINVQLLLLTTISIICFSGTAISELYSWTDENGTKRYTTSPPPSNQTNVTITPIKQNNNNIVKTTESVKQPRHSISTSNNKEPTETESVKQPRLSIKTSKNKELTEDEKDKIEKEINCVWNGMWDVLTKGKKGHPSDCMTPNSKENFNNAKTLNH